MWLNASALDAALGRAPMTLWRAPADAAAEPKHGEIAWRCLRMKRASTAKWRLVVGVVAGVHSRTGEQCLRKSQRDQADTGSIWRQST